MNPLERAGGHQSVVSGSDEEIASSVIAFLEAGFSQVDLMVSPGTPRAYEALAPILEHLRDAG